MYGKNKADKANRKIADKASYVIAFLISVFLFPILLVVGIQLTAFNEAFYANQYERLGTAETIGISADDLSRVTGELVDYIKGDRASLDGIEAEIKGEFRPVFNEREKAHMVDVKELFGLAARVRNVSAAGILLLFVALYFSSGKHPLRFLAASYLAAGAVLLVLLAVLIPLVRSDFTHYWDQFHVLFFDNDLWLLDPETDIMIQMLPEPFFQHAVARVAGFFAGGSILPGILSAWMLRHTRKRGKRKILEK